jgi:hypothetical protein
MASGLDNDAKSQGPVLLYLNLCLIVLSSIVMIGRLYARGFMARALGVDDMLALLGFVRLPANFPHCVVVDIFVISGLGCRYIFPRDRLSTKWIRIYDEHTLSRTAKSLFHGMRLFQACMTGSFLVLD